jgi:hypothetical protein
MKTYTSKPSEDLGSIARKFGMPSWKYLYELNKNVIGDNPDLLKEGTKLKIPQWDSTGGDEKIKAKDADPMAYTGGANYRYPWVPLSVSLAKTNENEKNNFEKDTPLLIRDRKTGATLFSGTLKSKDEFEALIADSSDLNIGIKGHPFKVNDMLHCHPDDDVKGTIE